MSQSETAERPAPPRRELSKPLREVTTIGELFTNTDFVKRIANAVPTIITPEVMLSSLAGSLRRSPDLAKCSIADVAGKALMLAQVGLPPDTPLQLAHLIPFNERRWNPTTRQAEDVTICQVVIGYHGLLDLAYRSGKVSYGVGRVVWQDEVDGGAFSYEYGTQEYLRHRRSLVEHDLSPRAQAEGRAVYPTYAYAQVHLHDKGAPFEVWPWSKVIAIRNGTPAYQFAARLLEDAKKTNKPLPKGYIKAPWIGHLEAMANKTMLRQLLNLMPRSVELAAVAAIDTMQERQPLDLGPIIDSTDYVSAAAEMADEGPDPDAAFGMRDTVDKPEKQQTPKTDDPAEDKRPAQTRRQSKAELPRSPTSGEVAPVKPPEPEGGVAGDLHADRQPSSTDSGGASFDEWVLDINGEPVGESTFTDPVKWALALEFEWRGTDQKETLLEQNADTIRLAWEASVRAAEIIDTLRPPPPEQSTTAEVQNAAAVVIPLVMERGKPNLAQYLKAFREAALDAPAGSLDQFVRANADSLMIVPVSTRGVALKAVAERAKVFGVPPPPMMAELMAPPPKESVVADTKTLIERELLKCGTAERVSQLSNSPWIKEALQKFEDRGEHAMAEEIRTKFRARYQALGGGPSG